MPEPSILDARLAEIDRRLRTIQSGLRPVDGDYEQSAELEDDDPLAAVPDPPDGGFDAPPPPPVQLHPTSSPPRSASASPAPASPAPASSAPAAPIAGSDRRIDALTDRLSALTAAHERLLELHRELLGQYAELLEVRAGDTAALAVTAGPFHSTAAVRAFEQAVGQLPGVSSVAVREFVGDERVQVDVRLAAR